MILKSIKRIFLNPKYFYLYFLFLLLFTLSFFRISGSSVGIYNNFFYGVDYQDKNLLTGRARVARGDEWNLATPFLVSQKSVNFNSVNTNIGLGQNMIALAGIPAKNLKIFFHPSSLMFFVLPLDNAYSFWWWSRGLLLIVSTYLIFLTITKKNYFLSISGSLIFFFSPFVQWWYSVNVLEAISFSLLILYFSIRLINQKNIHNIILNTLLITYFSLCFILTMYPPFLVSVGLLMIFFSIGYILNNSKLITSKNIKVLSICAGFILAVSMITLFVYYNSFRDIIELTMNTSYPGKRISLGGDFSILKFFSGFFNIEFLNEFKPIPFNLAENQSEGSNFFMLFPFLIPSIFYYLFNEIIYKKRKDFILIFIILYLLLSTTWIFFGLPSVISKFFLLGYVPSGRMIIGIGMANILLIIYFLSNVKITLNRDYRLFAFSISIVVFLFYFYIGFYYLPYFQSSLKLLVFSLIAALSLLLLILQRKKSFIILILAYSILSSFSVNPLYKGLDPLLKSKLSVSINKIESSNSTKARWIAFNSLYLGNYLVANGANSLNSVQIYPQINLWRQLDEKNKYNYVYNRYAHVVFEDSSRNEADFQLKQDDLFVVNINPCSSKIKNLKVKFIISPKKLNYACLSQLDKVSYPKINFFIYNIE